MATAKTRKSSHAETVLRHWREAVPNDRLAHLVKDATRGLIRALTMRLAEHQVAFGHWAFLRILWETDGLTQRELSVQAGVKNLLDRNYFYTAGYPEIGRNWFLNFRYRF